MNDWSRAEDHAERAHRFYEAGLWDRALAEIAQAVRLNPQQSDYQAGMGLTLEALRRFGEAVVCFERAIELRGDDDASLMLHLASNLIRCDRPAEALRVLDRVHELDAQCEPAYCQRILAHAHLGEHELAEEAFYMARLIVEECPVCLDHVAHSLALRGEMDRADRCWTRALELDPNFPDAHANLARSHWQRGRLEQARQGYVQQLRADPGDVGIVLELGQLLAEMGRTAEAGEKLRHALDLDPACAEAHLHLGQLALMSGHLAEAAQRLQAAARIKPDLPGVGVLQARVALREGRNGVARRFLGAELRRPPREPRQLVELARLCCDMNEPERAVALLDAMLSGEARFGCSSSERADALLCRGAAQLLLGHIDLGVRDSRASLRIDPRNVTAWVNLALAYERSERWPRARCAVRAARRIDPLDAPLRALERRLTRAQLLRIWSDRLRAALKVLRSPRRLSR